MLFKAVTSFINDCIWSMWEGNVFTGVCYSVHGEDASWMHPPPPPSDTTHRGCTPSLDARPSGCNPLQWMHPPPRSSGCKPPPPPPSPRQKTDGQQAVGTHPTGMYTCNRLFSLFLVVFCDYYSHDFIARGYYTKRRR